jgi:NAD(P)-dependent dehydrogenase (short-subunit alcohol dehydrogenase family)
LKRDKAKAESESGKYLHPSTCRFFASGELIHRTHCFGYLVSRPASTFSNPSVPMMGTPFPPRRADVRRESEVRGFVNGCVRRYGRIDIAFNNAGFGPQSPKDGGRY